jgi:hypothetical protein
MDWEIPVEERQMLLMNKEPRNNEREELKYFFMMTRQSIARVLPGLDL